MSEQRFMYPPLVAHGPDNRGAIVVVVTYSLMFITILFAILRAWSSHMQKRDLRWDDLTFTLAVLLIIPESVLTERAAGQGLGQHINAVDTSNLEQYYKYIYATQLLGVIIQALAKFSVVLMIGRITSELATKKSARLIMIAIAVWSIFSLFTIAFQCGVPRPWEFTNAKCAADGKLYYVVITGTIATDAVLASYFVPVVWKLQMTRATRLMVCGLFAVRLVVCAVSIPYLAVFPRYLSSDDKTWYNTNTQIFHQVVINMSVITAGVLSVRRFLSELQTGKLGMVLNDREIEMTSTGRSKTRSKDNNKVGSSQTSGFFSREKWGTRSQTSQRDGRVNISSLNDTTKTQLRPDETTRFTSHIFGGGSSDSAGRESGKSKPHSKYGNSGDDTISDDKSTSSLRKNGVYQQRDFEMHVEYDNPDGESRSNSR